MKIDTLNALFAVELSKIYDAEKRLLQALPKMAAASYDQSLALGFEEHIEETHRQAERIEALLNMLEIRMKTIPCDAMAVLIAECESLIETVKNRNVLDASLINLAQKIEHYEIATYGTLCALANCLGYNDAGSLLHKSLKEEKRANERLTLIAEGSVNSASLRRAA